MNLLRDAARWLIFPVVVFGVVGAAGLALAQGYSEILVVMGAVFISALVILGLQRAFPAIPEWRQWGPDAGVDVLHTLLSSGGGGAAAKAIAFGGLFWVSAAISEALGWTLWPTAWPVVLQLAVAIVISDLPAYLFHRASHAWEPLWRLHAMHHSSERLYVFSSGRSHPLHVAGTHLGQLAPLVALGAPAEVLALVSVFTSVHGFLQHANIDLVAWPFHHVFATADLHRWHHSTVRDEELTNFGNNLIVWDWLFGTRFLPADREHPDEVGLAGVDFPTDFFGHLASPFTWPRLVGRDPS